MAQITFGVALLLALAMLRNPAAKKALPKAHLLFMAKWLL
jgi:hypothetical protein